jgi:hypothetical protein
MKRMLATLSSPVVQGCIALPLMAWLLIMVYVKGVPPETAAGAAPAVVFAAVLAVMTGTAAAVSLRDRSYSAALVQIGAALLLLQVIALPVFRFHGTLSIGEGEGAPQYTEVEVGPLAKLPAVPLTLQQAQLRTAPAATFLVDGRALRLTPGESVPWNGHRLKLTALSEAPLFILRNRQGKELDAGYIKLKLDGRSPSFFQFAVIPHRIYAAPADRQGTKWVQQDGAWKQVPSGREEGTDTDDPAALSVQVMRGKLRITGKVLKPGEPLSFNEYAVAFEPGPPWAEFEVTKAPSRILPVLGAALIILGAAARLFKRGPA